MDADTLGRLRPQSTSAAAVQDALVALQQERAATVQRANAARAKRLNALMAGVSWEIKEADTALRDAASDAEMLDAMEPALAAKLAFAEMVEARGQAEVTEANEAAQADVAAFAAALPGYAKHAAAVAHIARLGEAAGQAVQRATALARSHGVQGPAVEMPGAITGTPSGFAVPLASLVRLPAPDGSGLLFGQWGPEHQPVPAFRYAP